MKMQMDIRFKKCGISNQPNVCIFDDPCLSKFGALRGSCPHPLYLEHLSFFSYYGVHLPARAVALLIHPLLFRTVLGHGALGRVYARSRLYALSRVHTLSLLRLFLI